MRCGECGARRLDSEGRPLDHWYCDTPLGQGRHVFADSPGCSNIVPHACVWHPVWQGVYMYGTGCGEHEKATYADSLCMVEYRCSLCGQNRYEVESEGEHVEHTE